MPSKRRRFYPQKRKQKQQLEDELSDQKSDKGKPKKQKGDHFEIERIDEHRIDQEKEKMEFLVRWNGYGDADRTWECFEFFSADAPEIVQEYLIKILSKKEQQGNEKEENKMQVEEEAKTEQKKEEEEQKTNTQIQNSKLESNSQ